MTSAYYEQSVTCTFMTIIYSLGSNQYNLLIPNFMCIAFGVFKHKTHSLLLEDFVLETSVMFGLLLAVGGILSADFFTMS